MSDYLNVSYISYKVEELISSDNFLDKKQITNYLKNNFSTHLEYLDSFYDPGGVSGVVFKNINTGEVIIGFTGTSESKDWKNNVESIVFSKYEYAEPAYRFYEDMKNLYGDNIALTGHSQGGGIAQRVAIEYNVQKAIVFNPAPLYTGLLNVTYDTLKIRE